MTGSGIGEFECYVTVRGRGERWIARQSGTSEQISAAIDELAERIRADIDAETVPADLMCRYDAESYWDDGHPLDFFGFPMQLKRVVFDLYAHAALIRQTVATGHKNPRDWNWPPQPSADRCGSVIPMPRSSTSPANPSI
ncbi:MULTISPECIES: hypothetical protein [unclassified Nocardia]|uniref:hypothetical protein n=1 Tax=unclassified Nocardia TaxID=2637762 RepID=UPI001CE47890|nr:MULTISPECIES: hypothetical protein [unclassified Nocardia]